LLWLGLWLLALFLSPLHMLLWLRLRLSPLHLLLRLDPGLIILPAIKLAWLLNLTTLGLAWHWLRLLLRLRLLLPSFYLLGSAL
jgi:hypothetical protein